MKLKKMFKQFMPSELLCLPLTMLGGMLALAWLYMINNTHWAPMRMNVINLVSEKLFKLLLWAPKVTKKSSWKLWMFTAFILCLSYNMFSLIPYTFSLTSHLSMTLSLSLPLWMSFQISGMMSKWKEKMSHLVPRGTPIYLMPLMVIMETISLSMQPLTLGFRLAAKLLAGHLLMFLSSCVVWAAISSSLSNFPMFILLITLLVLEMAVACIQAAVFVMLCKNYLEENLKN